MGKIVCKSCGSRNSIRLEYGMPDDAMISRIEAGEVMHGGCVVAGLTQDFYCLDCNAKFDKVSSDMFMKGLSMIKFKLSRTEKHRPVVHQWQLDFSHDGNRELNGFTMHYQFYDEEELKTDKKGVFIADMHEVKRQIEEIGLEYWLEEYHGEPDVKNEKWILELRASDYPMGVSIKKGYHHRPYTMVKWCRLLKKFNLSDKLFRTIS